ncbi:MAG: peptide-methionine (R)-S-oxide reductase [Vampirovibrionales bacterium]
MAHRTPPESCKKRRRMARSKLTNQQFDIARKKGTEPPAPGGTATTKPTAPTTAFCCGEMLFDTTKYDSGSGVAQFFTQPATTTDGVGSTPTAAIGMYRMEVVCTHSGSAHLSICVSRRPSPDRPALLHQLGVAKLPEPIVVRGRLP